MLPGGLPTLAIGHRINSYEYRCQSRLMNYDRPQLVERLRQLRSDLPVLVLTADQSLERRTRASEAGADEAFGADTYVEDLVHAIKRLISGGRSSTSRSISLTNVPNDTRLLRHSQLC
jgi:DNA-binding NarL/FixJ family response regulator